MSELEPTAADRESAKLFRRDYDDSRFLTWEEDVEAAFVAGRLRERAANAAYLDRLAKQVRQRVVTEPHRHKYDITVAAADLKMATELEELAQVLRGE